ncbi:MAG: LacI family DNA-binding transcriptional regulator [Spirochaetaceae bacterium]|nr:LacI family DNA-binding transcriptional regulator [Spirochaetaceae bacterium]
MITIKEIAKKANVSRGTVDRVIHNRKGVKPEVEALVKAIIDQLEYKTNSAGKLLATKKKPITIGCVVPSIGNDFFLNLISGFNAAYKKYSDYGLTIKVKSIKAYRAEEHLNEIKKMIASGIDALLVTTIIDPCIIRCLNENIDKGLHVACVNTDLPTSKRLFYVGPDYYLSGKTSAGVLTLMSKSKQNILIITGSSSMYGHNERIRGFLDTLEDKGIDYNVEKIMEVEDDEETAYIESSNFLKKHKNEITTIYIVAGGVHGTCKAIKELYLDKISNTYINRPYVLTFDRCLQTNDFIIDGTIDATIGQQPFSQGYKSISKMFHYLAFNHEESYINDEIMDARLIIKENALF